MNRFGATAPPTFSSEGKVAEGEASGDRVIVVNTSRIGDLVSGMGVVRFVRDRFGSATVLPEMRYAPVLEGEPGIRVVTPDEARGERWDILLDLSSSPKSGKIVRVIRARRKICLWRTPAKFVRSLFTHTDRLRRTSDHIVHAFDPFLRLFGESGTPVPVLTDNRNPQALTLLDDLRREEARILAGVHFDAASERRVMPDELLLGIVGGLVSLGSSVLLIGTRGDIARRIVDGSGGVARYLPLTLSELKTVTAGLNLFIGPDSGPLHIAAALGTPSVGIYGPNTSARSGPLAANVRIVELPLSCRPCNQNRPCPHGVRCLAGITPEMVMEAARELLGTGRTPAR
jgi:ADP-heptose:LPS heptosyltransferase